MKTKTRILLSIGTFILLLAFAIFYCWMGGYNFDYRGADVGFATFMIASFCVLVSAWPFLWIDLE